MTPTEKECVATLELENGTVYRCQLLKHHGGLHLRFFDAPETGKVCISWQKSDAKVRSKSSESNTP